MFLRFALGVLLLLAPLLRAAPAPEALLVVVGDQHSAYDRYAPFVARIDRIRAENPGVPLAILINGDAFEYGNAVARRTSGALDFALFAALVKRGPVIFNLGNHEPDLTGMSDVVARLRAAGVTVIGGNLRDRATGRPFAPPATPLVLGRRTLTIVGLVTDNLATFRAAVRPGLEITNPVAWAKQTFPSLLAGHPLDDTPSGPGLAASAPSAPSPAAASPLPRPPAAVAEILPVVLSHAGVLADRQILPLVPDGTLFAGAHDHLRFVHRAGRTVYFHSGSWLECLSLATLHETDGRPSWDVTQIDLTAADPEDAALAAVVRDTFTQTLTAEEKKIVGHTARALSPPDAARFAVEAARVAAGADAAVIGGTTFGAGLPGGDVSRYAFDACVRFDGTLCTADVDGAQLRRILSRANQRAATPLAERTGETLVAVAPATIDPGRRYRLVTTDWVARNPAQFLGDDPPRLTEQPALRLKPAVLAALNR